MPIPIVSLLCLWRSYSTLPRNAYPPAYQGHFTFPWKPVLVMGVYSFVYGLRGGIFSGVLAIHSGIGAFIGAALVYILVCAKVPASGRDIFRRLSGDDSFDSSKPHSDSTDNESSDSGSFDFSLLYKIAIPLMFLSLLPFDSVIPGWDSIANICALTSYTVLLLLIMAILCNLSYRYGVCAIWIFCH